MTPPLPIPLLTSVRALWWRLYFDKKLAILGKSSSSSLKHWKRKRTVGLSRLWAPLRAKITHLEEGAELLAGRVQRIQLLRRLIVQLKSLGGRGNSMISEHKPHATFLSARIGLVPELLTASSHSCDTASNQISLFNAAWPSSSASDVGPSEAPGARP